MGFLDKLGGAVAGAYGALQENAEEVEKYKEQYEYSSDQSLLRGLHYGSWAQKSACSLLLQERGYSKEEVLAEMKKR